MRREKEATIQGKNKSTDQGRKKSGILHPRRKGILKAQEWRSRKIMQRKWR